MKVAGLRGVIFQHNINNGKLGKRYMSLNGGITVMGGKVVSEVQFARNHID
jgi:hypothetical protein